MLTVCLCHVLLVSDIDRFTDILHDYPKASIDRMSYLGTPAITITNNCAHSYFIVNYSATVSDDKREIFCALILSLDACSR